jgi:DNA-binding NtrC family response regulator
VLIVDDDRGVRSNFTNILKGNGFSLIEALNSGDALDAYVREMPAAVLMDLNIPAGGGVEVMKRMKGINPIIPVIMITEYDDISDAVEAVKLGAYDFIVKPPKVDKLVFTLRRAIEELDLKRAVERLNTAMETSLEWTLGKGQAIKRIIKQIHQVAASDFSIIIQGETGTGKSFIANAIHSLSKRADKPFVTVDMGSIPETLVESKLFGHERGLSSSASNGASGFYLYYSLLNGVLYKARAGMYVQLLGDVGLMGDNRLDTYVQQVRDLLVAVALCQELQYLLFSVRQAVIAGFLHGPFARVQVPGNHLGGYG